jgi:hypothetical protein
VGSLYRLCEPLYVVGFVTLLASIAAGQEPVSVSLDSGRVFNGLVDQRTTADRFWLKSSQAGAAVLRPIQWNRIVEATVGEHTIGVDEFRSYALQAAEQLRETQPEQMPFGDDRVEEVPAPESQVQNTPGLAALVSATERVSPITVPGIVQSLYVDAYVANWDRDVEVDGIVVIVQPLDEFGQIVHVGGTVEVDLIGQRHSRRGEPSEPFPQIGRWSELARPSSRGDGIVLKLSYQGVHPEFDREIDPFGVVHVRMTIAGQGVFEASSAMVRLRPYSSPRDNQQQLRGRRFFYQETLGRGPRAGLTWPSN